MSWTESVLFVSLPPSTNSCVEALTSSVMVLGDEPFKKKLGLDEIIGVGPSKWNW
jgi:hypothetical protein